MCTSRKPTCVTFQNDAMFGILQGTEQGREEFAPCRRSVILFPWETSASVFLLKKLKTRGLRKIWLSLFRRRKDMSRQTEVGVSSHPQLIHAR